MSNAKAWRDPATDDVISAARKLSWETEFGEGGKIKAATYTEPLGEFIDPSKLSGAVASIHPDTLAMLNTAKIGADKPSAVWPARRADLRPDYVLLFTAEGMSVKPLPLPVDTGAQLRKLASEYRPTMSGDVLHHWAAELAGVIRGAPNAE